MNCRIYFKYIFRCLCLLLLSTRMFAQCTGGTAASTITITPAWQTISSDGGKYFTFTGTAGRIYQFSFCSTIGGGASTFNTQITILNNSNVPMAGGYNDDFCGTQSFIAWTCPATATYRVLCNRFNCTTRNNMGTLAYRYTNPLSCPGTLGSGVTNVASLPYASGAGTTCGAGNDLDITNMISCGNSQYLDGEDRVWIFTPAVTGTVTINLVSSVTNFGLVLFDGCPLTGQGGTCIAASQSSSVNQTIVSCLGAGKTYYLILDNDPGPTCQAYTNLTISAPVPAGTCNLGTGVVNVASLPYSILSQTTCGAGNDITSLNGITCGSANYFSGEDAVYKFTPASSGTVSITLTSTGTYTGIMLYDGCPITSLCSGSVVNCIDYSQSSSGNKSLCATVTAGITYYLVIDSWTTSCNPYNLSISAPVTSLQGSVCSNAVVIPSLPFTANNESTACMGNNYSNASLGSCGTLYESGQDRVYSYTSSGSECIGISLSGTSTNSIGFTVYNGCPGVAGTTCIGSAGGATSGTISGSITLPSAGTYYIIVDGWAPPSSVTYNISISAFGSGSVNDLPCNAFPLTLGIPVNGTNNCSGNAGEPVAPACWVTPNTINSVWYSFVAPASQQVRIKALPGSLTNPQIAVYSGSCGAGLTNFACNDDGASCGYSANYGSDLLLTGLTTGNTYYIQVDGYGTATGSFSILANDGSLPLPNLSNGQDCGTYLPVCSYQLSFGNPGFQAFGNICDFPGGGGICLLSGERSSAWFQIDIASTGFLEFSIVPKDWVGAPSTICTDYDFAIWKIAGTGATNCAAISAGATPSSCNYSAYGITGLFSTTAGTNPSNYPGFGSAFNQRLAVTAGDKYALLVSNFSNSTSGFDLIFSATSPINTSPTTTAATWSGGIDTDWNRPENWGGCPVPSCTRDAVINGSVFIQPFVQSNVNARAVFINPGASLSLGGGKILSVCDNFTNFGSLNAANNSFISFVGAGNNQQLNGSLTGTNAFGGVQINKNGGSVTQLQNTDVKGDFIHLVVAGTSTYNVNGYTQKIGGNFAEYAIYQPGSGTLEFNGSGSQSYSNFNVAAPDLNIVVMNHGGSGVTLASNMNIGTAGTLTLNQGKILTTASFEVNVKNRTPSALSTGNNNSYVVGFLRRSINATGSYDFPLGSLLQGYQRANINYAYTGSPTAIDNIRGIFQAWGSVPSPLGSTDCGNIYSNNALNNGFWRFAANATPSSGNFDLTLYNNGYSNHGSSNSWTVMRSNNNGVTWAIGDGTCASSTVAAVKRTGMTTISADFGTAQSPNVPLPVEWLSFTATPLKDHILLTWSTASETENRGFEIYRSEDQYAFKQIGWMDGHGNTSAVSNYNFEDADVTAGRIYYYKLRQIDYDGKADESRIVSAKLNKSGSNISVFPNPLTKETMLTIHLSQPGTIQVDLINALGETISVLNEMSQREGLFEIPMTADKYHLPAGCYILRTSLNGEVNYCKLIVADR